MTIRLLDPAWPADPRRAANQLMFLLPEVPTPFPQPVVKYGLRRPGTVRPKRRPRGTPAPTPPDDPRICPPTTVGQLALFPTPRRRLKHPHAGRILGRTPDGYPQAVMAADQYSRERGASATVRRRWLRLLRLALAARDADGEQLVTDAVVDQLAECAEPVREILRHAELIADRSARGPGESAGRARAGPAGSCRDCDAWGPGDLCGGCRGWRQTQPTGRCARCRRDSLPLANARCHGCTIAVIEDGPDAAGSGWTQLWFGGAFAPRLHQRAGGLGYQPPKWRAAARERAHRPPPPPTSEHLTDPRQLAILDAPRSWRAVAHADGPPPPRLTPTAAALLERFEKHARARGWKGENLGSSRRTLELLLGWLGAAAPILEADVRALAGSVPGASAHRALHFLAEHHTLIADPARQISADQRATDVMIASLPDGIDTELRRWVQVQRGLGRRAHPALSWKMIRAYLDYALPVLAGWSRRVESLREITRADIDTATAQLNGNAALARRTALRSIFRSLKQERIIFHDPTRGAETLTAARPLPAPLPSHALRGLLDRADGVMAQLIVALVAVHALGVLDVRGLRLRDLDASRGRLLLTRRRGRRHIVYLDTTTHRLALDWLTVRHDTSPRTRNTHLMVTDHSASSAADPMIAAVTVRRIFRDIGVSASQLRQDRILDEAAVTADPVHLMRLFGVSTNMAMRYVYAAHPERHS